MKKNDTWELVSEGNGLAQHYVVRSQKWNAQIELSNNEEEAQLLLSTLTLLSQSNKKFNICSITSSK